MNAIQAGLSVLLSDLLGAGDEHLTNAYAIGKGYSAAKSGIEVQASDVDKGILAKSIDINTKRIADMINNMEVEVMNINPTSFATNAEYVAAIDATIEKYASRVSSISYFAEQPFLDGFVQGGKEAQHELAGKFGADSSEVGFIWVTAGDERVCETCLALDGSWFPLEHGVGTWTAHPGCRCPEHFRYGVKK